MAEYHDGMSVVHIVGGRVPLHKEWTDVKSRYRHGHGRSLSQLWMYDDDDADDEWFGCVLVVMKR